MIGVELDQTDTGETGGAVVFATVDQLNTEPDSFGASQRGFEMVPEADQVDEGPSSPVKIPGSRRNPVPTGMLEAAHIVGRRGGEESHWVRPLETGDGGKPRSAGNPTGDGDAERALECPLDLEHSGFLGCDPEWPDPVDRNRDEDPDQDDNQGEFKKADT